MSLYRYLKARSTRPLLLTDLTEADCRPDPLDSFLCKLPEIPNCQHLDTYIDGPQLVCTKCQDVLVDLLQERENERLLYAKAAR